MSKVVVVYREHPTQPIKVQVLPMSNHIGPKIVIPLMPHQYDGPVCTNKAVCTKKYFGVRTLDGSYRYSYTAYVHDTLDHWEITTDIADTIFMMAEKEKLPV
jgi:hypothetical protein